MASNIINVYCRIRLPTEADIIAMAVAKAKGEDVMPILTPYLDISMEPFNDNAPTVFPGKLVDLIKTIKVSE